MVSRFIIEPVILIKLLEVFESKNGKVDKMK